jgi:hypothetical protein
VENEHNAQWSGTFFWRNCGAEEELPLSSTNSQNYPLWCVPALAARFPRAFCLPSAVCALSCCAPSRPPRGPVHPLTPLSRPSLATPPSSACSLQLPCVLLLLPRISALSRVAACFCVVLCAAISHAPNLAARAPRAAPCRTCVTSRSFASGFAAARLRASLRCCCRAVAVVPPADPLTFSPCAHPDASPRTPRTIRP